MYAFIYAAHMFNHCEDKSSSYKYSPSAEPAVVALRSGRSRTALLCPMLAPRALGQQPAAAAQLPCAVPASHQSCCLCTRQCNTPAVRLPCSSALLQPVCNAFCDKASQEHNTLLGPPLAANGSTSWHAGGWQCKWQQLMNYVLCSTSRSACCLPTHENMLLAGRQ
jgi:hypothetical protein